MNDATTTGTLALGRWQLPAALINAGRVTPDPYPLEQVLHCAGCGEQFFGTHAAGGTNPASGQDTANRPALTNGTNQPGDTRVYRTSCACRPAPLPASEVELRVYAETHVAAFGTNAITGFTSAHYALLSVRFFSRIEVGPTVDHLNFTARI